MTATESTRAGRSGRLSERDSARCGGLACIVSVMIKFISPFFSGLIQTVI